MNNTNGKFTEHVQVSGRKYGFFQHSQSATTYIKHLNSLFIHLFNDLLSQFILIWYIIGYAICRIVRACARDQKEKRKIFQIDTNVSFQNQMR